MVALNTKAYDSVHYHESLSAKLLERYVMNMIPKLLPSSAPVFNVHVLNKEFFVINHMYVMLVFHKQDIGGDLRKR